MIKNIKYLKNFGIFKNYTPKDKEVEDFNKFNLIYGWNGSGKTTLSRLLRCFELQKIHDDFIESDFRLQTDKGMVSCKDLPQKINIRVFNKDFIDENVFTSENTAKPIYYLGKEDIDQKNKLESLKNQERELNTKLDHLKQKLKDKEKDQKKLTEDKAKLIKEVLRTAGKDQYTNYDKSNFCKNIENLNKDIIDQHLLNEEYLKQKKNSINQIVKDKIHLLSFPLFNEEDLKQINKILKKGVISKTIDKLKNNNTLNQWVKEGLALHNKFNESNCYFCEQLMPEKRIEDLKNHFSQDYENLIKNVNNLEQKWDSKKIDMQRFNKHSLYDDLFQSFQEEQDELNRQIKRYNQFITKVLEQLQQKQKNPFQELEDINYETFQIKEVTTKINKIISYHNEKTDNFAKNKLEDKQSIEKHFLSECYEHYQSLKIDIDKIKKSIEALKLQKVNIKQQLELLFQKRRDYKQTAQTLNQKLKSFLGREELIFEATSIEDEGYYIKRNAQESSYAISLSEGEKTAVALIYFLSKLKEDNFDLNNGIVVIDDPISSLDSNSIFQAFGFIKAEVKQAKQVFILTHNFDFFKHIKHWFYKEKAEFYMIKNFVDQHKRTAKLSHLDSLLKDYDSEYHYIFNLLYKLNSDNRDLQEIYPVPNIARKFMEAFLSFKFPSAKNFDELFSKAKKKTNFDSGKIEKIKRFINAHSHSDMDTITGWDISQWSESKQVIQDILTLVEELDEEHYKGLCKASKKTGL